MLLRRGLRVAFGLLYHQLAWTYDLVSWTVSMGQWRDWQRTALPFLPEGAVLEVAHGPGHMLLALSRAGRQPVGLDLSPSMGRLAQRRLRRAGLPARLLRASVTTLPLPAGAFDGLLSTFPTEFIADPAAIAEFYRVLRPGGVLACVPSATITGPWPPDRVAAWLFRVTGQSAEAFFEPLTGKYSAAGFVARIEQLELKRSLVHVLVAQRPA
jgi:ubiquinone/menaquinone biosynthesis C-methylase UbiE